MRQGFYRAFLFLLLVFAPLQTIVDLVAMERVRAAPTTDAYLMVTLLVLQPVCAVGLWNDRGWGLGLLVCVTVVCALVMFPTAIPPMILLAITAVRWASIHYASRPVAAASEDRLP